MRHGVGGVEAALVRVQDLERHQEAPSHDISTVLILIDVVLIRIVVLDGREETGDSGSDGMSADAPAVEATRPFNLDVDYPFKFTVHLFNNQRELSIDCLGEEDIEVRSG